MSTVVHIVGTVIDIGTRTRQCCAWCGALLLDYDLTRIAVPLGQDATAPAHFPPGALLEVDGNCKAVVAHEDGARLPANACATHDAHTTDAMHIIFAANPDSPDLTFVEVENERGESISVGQWSERDGYKVLTIPTSVRPPTEQELRNHLAREHVRQGQPGLG